MMNILVRHINEEELSTGEGIEGEELVQWYLEQIEDELQNVEQHDTEMLLVRKVMKRLVKVISFLYSSWEYKTDCE